MTKSKILAGIDRSAKFRQAAVVDAGGEALDERAFARGGEGFAAMVGWVLRRGREGRAAALCSRPVPAAPGAVKAVSEAAAGIVKDSKSATGLRSIWKRTKETLGRIKAEGEGCTVEIAESVPGIGSAVLAVIVSEVFDSFRRADLQGLRCCFGVAPVTKRSGRAVLVQRRRTANQRVADASCRWAAGAVLRDDVGKANCRTQPSRGRKHARALRSVADRMIRVVRKMIETGETFDPERRSKNSP